MTPWRRCQCRPGRHPRQRGQGRQRPRDDRGSALVEFVWLGILLLIPLVWILVSVFSVQQGAFAASGAARAAGRAYVLADTDAQGKARAEAAARQAFADQGIGGVPLEVSVRCRPLPQQCHAARSEVTVTVASRVDLPLLPQVLGGGAPRFPVSATHTVPVGQYQETAGE